LRAAGIGYRTENVRWVVGPDDARLPRTADGPEVVSEVCVVIRFDDAGLLTRARPSCLRGDPK
jgi:hypothetical protein